MRKTILLTLLAVVSSSAVAEWVLAGRNEITAAYFDPATISKTGNTVKMWNLFDLRTARLLDKQPYMSMKRQVEYDCKEERSRLLSFSGHSENMAGGEVVFSDSDPHNWEPVSPGSGNETLWKIACGKR
jgi:Surface-adhesin protein E